MPQSIWRVPPPSEDYLPVERDLTACAVEVKFSSYLTKDSNREEVVDKSRKAVGHVRVWW
jgi:hypothetical protein